MLEQKIKALFLDYPDVLFGFAGIDYSPYADQYPSALVFAVPYAGQLTLEDYTEESFDRGIHAAKERLEEIVQRLEAILRESTVRYWVPPVAQENETDLLAPFSFKFAAVNAGLGWIGRNDVVITKRYGPRVRLSVILIDAVFEYGQPITRSECPEVCRVCVEICPCKALLDQSWTIESRRSEIIDYQRCNRMRSAFREKLGRKNACGLCMTVCPIGRSAPQCESSVPE